MSPGLEETAERVLLLTPTGADTEVAASLLAEADLSPFPCESLADVCHRIGEGAGAIVVAEEALISAEAVGLIDFLAAQPPWSDIPVIVLTTRTHEGSSTVELSRLFAAVGNLVVLERPFTSAAFLVTVHGALRARRKQYVVRKVLESEKAARGAAERASRMKDEFLATVSHELRTPLNAILGWAQLVRREDMSAPDRARGLETIERNARSQTRLIEDLLDMSSVMSGKIRLDVQSVSLATIIEAAVDTVRPAASAKGIHLQTTIDPLIGPVLGDPNRLQQVVWNLLSNGVKFTPRGGRVQVVLRGVNAHAEIVVSDTGQGIPAEFLGHIFERFWQGDGSTTRPVGGLGLGLAIVQHLVELHRGTVRAASAGENKGSTFTVVLPLAVARSASLVRRRPRPGADQPDLDFDARALQGVKVLTVDDEPDARELVTQMLTRCGAQVRSAGSAAEALEELLRFLPDVLISDIAMPGMDGYEFLRRARARGAQVPAIALTAFARSEDRTRALNAGYGAQVSKPVESSELIATVASLAGRP
jgi:signal transduction histidine kinase